MTDWIDKKLVLPCDCGVCVVRWWFICEAFNAHEESIAVDFGTFYPHGHGRLLRHRLRDAWKIVRGKGDVYGEGVQIDQAAAEKLARFLLDVTGPDTTKDGMTTTPLPEPEATQ